MRDTLIYLALAEAALTIVLTRAMLKWLGLRRWVSAVVLSGLALPVIATVAAWLFMMMQSPTEQAGAGMLFAMVALLALYAFPICLASAVATTLVSKRTSL